MSRHAIFLNAVCSSGCASIIFFSIANMKGIVNVGLPALMTLFNPYSMAQPLNRESQLGNALWRLDKVLEQPMSSRGMNFQSSSSSSSSKVTASDTIIYRIKLMWLSFEE